MSELSYEALVAARREVRNLTATSNVPGYEALSRLAPILSCMEYGHPDQPTRRLRRFRQQPWRCDRCCTWWVTEHFTDYIGGGWRWMRVDGELGADDE